MASDEPRIEVINSRAFQRKFGAYIARVRAGGTRLVVTCWGGEAVAIVSREDLARLEQLDETK